MRWSRVGISQGNANKAPSESVSVSGGSKLGQESEKCIVGLRSSQVHLGSILGPSHHLTSILVMKLAEIWSVLKPDRDFSNGTKHLT